MSSKSILAGAAAAIILIPAAALAALVMFGTAEPPPPMAAVDGKALADARSQPLPPLERFTARDGVDLAYRSYAPAGSGQPSVVAVLVHGSGGSSANMNIVGRALAAHGVAAFAPDVRGHGESGARGDIGYIGQLEHDLADLVAHIRRSHPEAGVALVGHSSGGGFVLRVAGAPEGRLFSRFVLLAPYLGHAAPTSRPAAGGWVSAYTGRIVGLAILGTLGVHAFDGLPTLAFASQPGRPVRTWSYRLMENFGPRGAIGVRDGAEYRDDAAEAPGPVSLLVGERDESMFADRYAAAFAGVRPPVAVEVLPRVGHMGVLSEPAAVARIVAAVRGAAGERAAPRAG